ncbi:MAG TPA: arginine decarboxylase [Bacteroidales bacterium]|nr:arginine decarboxylase [Bacteroidales bacterium]HQL70011.1 arginine decarboxylase [Bacteroidales bacterium]
MKLRYVDLIEQSFEFPQEEFYVEDGELYFHDIALMDIVKQYGTPLKFTYLPRISENINRARVWFNVAIAKANYTGKYIQCYCTKSNHFSFVLEEVLKNKVHLETSSAFDVDIIKSLELENIIDKSLHVVCNGYKMPAYIEKIAELINSGYANVIPVLDNTTELDSILEQTDRHINIGIRIASEEEPKFEFYTSRLGLGYKNIMDYYETNIQNNPQVSLKMLHFFINTGIKDTAYYWNELHKCLQVYCQLKKICPSLNALNIGGGFPVKNNLTFEYEYEYMAEEIVNQIKIACEENEVEEPDIYTEFGTFTVGESGGALYSVVNQKQQNDREKWNMIDSSFITTLPDTWATSKRFLMLPVNHWEKPYERVFLGGLTCDSDDYYNSEQHVNAIYLPEFDPEDVLYLGFFNIGAYQETIGGFGGLQHCLIPCPKHIIINKDEDGKITTRMFSKEQSYKSMLRILGYNYS